MQHGNGTKIAINEVSTRDGFQMESRFIETDDKGKIRLSLKAVEAEAQQQQQ